MEAERQRLRRKVHQLRAHQGRHSSFTTIYVPPTKNLTDTISFVKAELAGAENIKSKQNRKNVSDNLTAILSNLEELQDMIRPKSLVVIVLIEGGKVTVGYLRGKHMELIRDEDFFIIGKTRAGGQSAKRYDRLRDEKMVEFFKFVGRLLNKLLVENLENIDAIVLGGNTIRAQEFLEKGDLDYRLRKKVAEKIIPVSIIDETGLYQAMKEASRILKETEIYAERQAWDDFMGDLMKGNTTATYGKKEVLEALKAGRVRTILVIEDDMDLVDEFMNEAQTYGSEVMVFSSQTESGAQLKSFGGVAAKLRW
jgi:peptide chain release factor subunit 1